MFHLWCVVPMIVTVRMRDGHVREVPITTFADGNDVLECRLHWMLVVWFN